MEKIKKTKRIFVVLIAAALVGIVSYIGTTDRRTSQAAVFKVMPLGDSITEGMHNTVPSPDGGYRQVLKNRFGAGIDLVGSLSNNNVGVTDPQHEGHSGWRTDQINGSISGWINTYRPDIVLYHIGTNDVLQRYASSHMITNLDQSLGKIFAANPATHVVLASLIPMWGPPGTWTPPTRTELNNAIPGLVTKYKGQGRNIHYANMATGNFFSDNRDFPDGVHPNLQGYTKMANVWEPIMRSIMGGTVTPPQPPPPGQVSQTNNLLNGKTFTSSASDSTSEPGNPVSNVNDKNESTRWISVPQDATTLTADLGMNYTLTGVSVLWAANTIRNYDLQVSANNSTWTTIASGVTNNSASQLTSTTSFQATPTGRYFRIVAKDRWVASYGNSIYEIGVYGTAASNADTSPPAVTLTAPANGAAITASDIVPTATLTATASDNTGVTKVEFYDNGALVGTDTTTPYSFGWTTGVAGSHALTAKAYDAAGNTTTSAASTVTVTLAPYPGIMPGDVNGDSRVNALDLSALISHDGQNYPAADFNKDGTVGAADMAILLSKWTW
ncbi:MAG TPA: GDSL-type esterase/lipase family protein [Candidatus Saccharimonadales bacterium]|jgi:lysophospholipase L1-like esterase